LLVGGNNDEVACKSMDNIAFEPKIHSFDDSVTQCHYKSNNKYEASNNDAFATVAEKIAKADTEK
jgi:hypothetical protein